jgi:aromatic ring-opening dioxygenase catalytic subunit (LigB family)
MPQQLPTYFLSHGGGPWPYMEGSFRDKFTKLEQSLLSIRRELGNSPRSILMVSGHWEETEFTLSSGERPGMLYDYSGFPEYLYYISYDAPGSPELAARVQALLQAGGIKAGSDPKRGFDHGTFSLAKPLYPDADIPIVQLSLNDSLDPATHLQVGRLLAPLRDHGTLIIGSGLSYHNLGMCDARGVTPSRQFDEWLQDTLVNSAGSDRSRRLTEWAQAPYARAAHPREDHLIPLMVAVGAAESDAGLCVYHQNDFLGFVTASSFRFGALPLAH